MPGIMAADAKSFFRWAAQLKNDNAQKRILSDRHSDAREGGRRAAAPSSMRRRGRDAWASTAAPNSRAAEAAMQRRLRARALRSGVGMIAPETVFLSLRHGAGSRMCRSSPMSCSGPA